MYSTTLYSNAKYLTILLSECYSNAAALDYDAQLAMVLEMSKQQSQQPPPGSQQQEDLEKREQEELEKILALSLIEK